MLPKKAIATIHAYFSQKGEPTSSNGSWKATTKTNFESAENGGFWNIDMKIGREARRIEFRTIEE